MVRHDASPLLPPEVAPYLAIIAQLGVDPVHVPGRRGVQRRGVPQAGAHGGGHFARQHGRCRLCLGVLLALALSWTSLRRRAFRR